MSVCTTDGVILDVNQAALRAIDAHIEAFIGKHLWESPWFAQNPQEAAKLEKAPTLASSSWRFMITQQSGRRPPSRSSRMCGPPKSDARLNVRF